MSYENRVIDINRVTHQGARRLYEEGKPGRSGEYSLDTKEHAVQFFKACIGGKLLNEKFHERVPYPNLDEEGRLVQNVHAKSARRSFSALDYLEEPTSETESDYVF